MKKIVSILIAVVMMLSFSIVSFAAGEFAMYAELEENSYEIGDEFEISLLSDSQVWGIGFKLHFDTSVFEVVETGPNRKSIAPMYEVKDGYIYYVGTNDKAIGVDLYLVLAVKDGAETGDYEFTFEIQPENTTLDGTTNVDTVSSEPFTIHIDGVEPADPTPEVATVVPTEAVLTTPKEAMVEQGQAVAMTFAAADLKGFAGMNWELTFADTTKYAKVEYPAETIAALGDAAPVQFVAAFRVKANGGELNAITKIAAGFCDANKELAGITAAVAAR